MHTDPRFDWLATKPTAAQMARLRQLDEHSATYPDPTDEQIAPKAVRRHGKERKCGTVTVIFPGGSRTYPNQFVPAGENVTLDVA